MTTLQLTQRDVAYTAEFMGAMKKLPLESHRKIATTVINEMFKTQYKADFEKVSEDTMLGYFYFENTGDVKEKIIKLMLEEDNDFNLIEGAEYAALYASGEVPNDRSFFTIKNASDSEGRSIILIYWMRGIPVDKCNSGRSAEYLKTFIDMYLYDIIRLVERTIEQPAINGEVYGKATDGDFSWGGNHNDCFLRGIYTSGMQPGEVTVRGLFVDSELNINIAHALCIVKHHYEIQLLGDYQESLDYKTKEIADFINLWLEPVIFDIDAENLSMLLDD